MKLVVTVFCVALAVGASAAERRIRAERERPLGWPQYGSVDVDVIGRLRAGIVAIGGETTGIVVRAENVDWELAFGRDIRLRRLAQRLDGRTVRVSGRLDIRRGVERGLRHIIHVVELRPLRSEAASGGGREPQPIEVSAYRRDETAAPAGAPRPRVVTRPDTERRPFVVRSRDVDVDPLDPNRAQPRGTVPRYLEEEPMPHWNDNDDLDAVFRPGPADDAVREMGTITPSIDLDW